MVRESMFEQNPSLSWRQKNAWSRNTSDFVRITAADERPSEEAVQTLRRILGSMRKRPARLALYDKLMQVEYQHKDDTEMHPINEVLRRLRKSQKIMNSFIGKTLSSFDQMHMELDLNFFLADPEVMS